MKADLHLHTCHSFDSGAKPKSIVEQCIKTGLDCIAVTDHNSIEGAFEVRDLAPFHVIIGEEVRSVGGDIIGLFLQEEIPKGLSPEDTVYAIVSQGGLVMVPHPFDRVRSSVITPEALSEVVEKVDIMETFNAHNIFRNDNLRAESFARDFNLIRTAVSDSHTPGELGYSYVEMPDFDGTPAGLKASLAQAKLVGRKANPIQRLAPTYSKLRKKLI